MRGGGGGGLVTPPHDAAPHDDTILTGFSSILSTSIELIFTLSGFFWNIQGGVAMFGDEGNWPTRI